MKQYQRAVATDTVRRFIFWCLLSATSAVRAEWGWTGESERLGTAIFSDLNYFYSTTTKGALPVIVGDSINNLTAIICYNTSTFSLYARSNLSYSQIIISRSLSNGYWSNPDSIVSERDGSCALGNAIAGEEGSIYASLNVSGQNYSMDKVDGQWGSLVNIGTSNKAQPSRLAFIDRDSLIAVWKGIDKLFSAQRKNDLWSPEKLLWDSGYNNTSPMYDLLASDKGENAVEIWVEKLGSDYKLKSAIFAGGEWQSASDIAISDKNIQPLALEYTNLGAIAVWVKDTETGSKTIEVAKLQAGLWKVVDGLALSGILNTRAVIDANGNVLMVWVNESDESNIKVEGIFYNSEGWGNINTLKDGLLKANGMVSVELSNSQRNFVLGAWSQKSILQSALWNGEMWGSFSEISRNIMKYKISFLQLDKDVNGIAVWEEAPEFEDPQGRYSNYMTTRGSIHPFKKLSLKKLGKGVIDSNPKAYECKEDCIGNEFAVFQGDNIEFMATPAEGYAFSGWSGDCSGDSECIVDMSSDKKVTAIFTVLPKFTLRVLQSPGGHTDIPVQNISCYKACNLSFYKGETVKLVAIPSYGYFVKGWVGCAEANGDECSLTVDKAVTKVKPVFAKLPKYSLSVTKTKYGKVISSPPGLSCGKDMRKCSAKFTVGADVTLTLVPIPGHTYIGWSGACEGVTTDTCMLKMDGPKNVGAMFQ